MEAYMHASPPPSWDFSYAVLAQVNVVGVEAHHLHLHPRQNVPRLLEYMGISNIEETEDCYRSSAEWGFFRRLCKSSNGGMHQMHEHAMVNLIRSIHSLSKDTRTIDWKWLDELPPADTPTMHCTSEAGMQSTTTRGIVAEVFEQQGRYADAIEWAQADLQTPQYFNAPSKIRAGRVLGRCHAALGSHLLSMAAFDAAIVLAKSRKLLLSEVLAIRGRAMADAATSSGQGSASQWDKSMGNERLAEVIERMQGPREVLNKLFLLQ
jgi:hypothetical protein